MPNLVNDLSQGLAGASIVSTTVWVWIRSAFPQLHEMFADLATRLGWADGIGAGNLIICELKRLDASKHAIAAIGAEARGCERDPRARP